MPPRHRDMGDFTPNGILKRIMRAQFGNARDYTYIILGRVGPTGKTWLTNELKNHGFTALEIANAICDRVEYPDDTNHYICDDIAKQVVIILNRRIER